jgi:hypothetical protein
MTMLREARLAALAGLVATTAASAQAPAPPAATPGAPLGVHQQNCLLKMLESCGAKGQCAPLDNLKGEKLPVKMTVDLAAGVVAGVNREGWVDATRIVSVAQTPDELILQGIDSAVAWQLLLYEKDRVMSFSLATGDTATIGFGDCTAAE